MFGNAEPTQFDLRFSLFGIPVRVHPLFWVVTAALGWSRDVKATFLWVACVFISVLVHEFGHALTAKYFGWRPEVVLYMMGGYAAHYAVWGRSTLRMVLMIFAGPGAGFVLFALIYGIELAFHAQRVVLSDYGYMAFKFMEFINLWWGLVNLLPVYPLDGGQIVYETLGHFQGNRGRVLAIQVSMVFGIIVALAAVKFQMTMAAMLFGSMAFTNFQMLQGGQIR